MTRLWNFVGRFNSMLQTSEQIVVIYALKPRELRIHRQLTHPLLSPILQSSLGNLCPLYIIAGDGEVLRDEIIYLAHKAANPSDYPTRKGVVLSGRRQMENVDKFRTPTKVSDTSYFRNSEHIK